MSSTANSPSLPDKTEPVISTSPKQQSGKRKRASSAASSISVSAAESDSETEETVVKPLKKPGNFSIQSILARPEPLRPTMAQGSTTLSHPFLEHLPHYAQLLQANFAAHCFPHKFPNPSLFYPWPMPVQPPLPELPGNQSYEFVSETLLSKI